MSSTFFLGLGGSEIIKVSEVEVSILLLDLLIAITKSTEGGEVILSWGLLLRRSLLGTLLLGLHWRALHWLRLLLHLLLRLLLLSLLITAAPTKLQEVTTCTQTTITY